MSGHLCLITPGKMQQITSMLDYCYRQGVGDARRLDDEGLAWEFMNRVEKCGEYGYLEPEERRMDEVEWTLRLKARAMSVSWSGVMSKYLQAMGRPGQNYLSVFVPLAQSFYAQGVRDYTLHPKAGNWAVFSTHTRTMWTERGVKPRKIRQWVDDIRMMCFDLQRRDEAVIAKLGPADARKAGALKPFQYKHFINAVGLVFYERERKRILLNSLK